MSWNVFRDGGNHAAGARSRIRAFVLVMVVFALAAAVPAACSSEPDTARCEICGMRIDPRSGWRAGAEATPEPLTFDTPKCLFRYSTGAAKSRARG